MSFYSTFKKGLFPQFALAAVAACWLGQMSAHAAETALGLLIFQPPRTDEHGVKTRGLARPIFSTWLRHESRVNTTVFVTYLDSQTVPVHFMFTSDAEAFDLAIQSGKSVDLTSCAHPRYVNGTSPDQLGCYESTYRVEFHCDLLSLTDRPRLIEPAGVHADDYDTHGTAEPEITYTLPECLPISID